MTAPTLVIGNYNYSSWSMRPWLLLTAFGIEFRTEQESLRHLGSDDLTNRLRAWSPSARVPVLIDKGITLWDSLAICEYVSERLLDGKGWPADTEARAYARCVAAEMHSGLSDLRNEMPMNIRARRRVEPSDGCLRDIERVMTIWGEGQERFGSQGPWLAGEFSIADCMYAPVVMRFRTYGVGLDDAAAAYAARLGQHPAVTAWMALAAQETEIVDEDEAGDPIH